MFCSRFLANQDTMQSDALYGSLHCWLHFYAMGKIWSMKVQSKQVFVEYFANVTYYDSNTSMIKIGNANGMQQVRKAANFNTSNEAHLKLPDGKYVYVYLERSE